MRRHVLIISCLTAYAAWTITSVGCAADSGLGTAAAQGDLGDLPPEDPGTVGGISDIPNPSAEMAAKGGKQLVNVRRGHEIFMLKCGECHYYMMPEEGDIMDWEDTMPEMIRHAGLGRAEENAVLDYVVAVRAMHGIHD